MCARTLVLAIVLLSSALPTLAREWSDSTGKSKVDAEYLEYHDGSVRLKTSEGRVLTVPLDRLSTDDQLFVFIEMHRRQSVVPELGPEGKKHSSDLLTAVRDACVDLAGRKNVRQDDFKVLEKAQQAFLAHSAKIVDAEGSRAAVTPAIIALLSDENVAVRLVGVRAIIELGECAYPALPALARLLDDNSPLVQRSAAESLNSVGFKTDVAAPSLAELVGGDNLQTAERAADSLTRIDGGGPRLAKAIPILVGQLKDANRKPELRAVSAAALSEILPNFRGENYLRIADISGFDFAYDHPELMRRIESEETAREIVGVDETIVVDSCRQLLPVLEDPSAKVRSGAVRVLASNVPELLAELPNAAFVKLLQEEEQSAPEGDFYDGAPLIASLMDLSHQGRMPLKLTPGEAVQLLGSGKRRYQEFAQAQFRQMNAKAREALPDLAKLVKHDNASVRRAALSVLSAPQFSSRDDRSLLPSLRVELAANKDGSLERIRVDGEAIANPAALQGRVAAYQPPRAEVGVDIDAVLKTAVADAEFDVRYQALQGLAARGTNAAKAALADVSRKSVDRESREYAKNLLDSLNRRRDFEFPLGPEIGQPEGDDPFAAEKPEDKPLEARELAVVVAADPELQLRELSAVLSALIEAKATGVRLIGTVDMPVEIQLQQDPNDGADEFQRDYYREDYLHLRLEPGAGGRARILVRKNSQGEWIPAPTFESLQFMLTYNLAPRSDEFAVAAYYGPADATRLGHDALPYLVDFRAEPTASYSDLLGAINAIGIRADASSNSRRMLQWIKLSIGDEPSQLWYTRVIPPDMGAK